MVINDLLTNQVFNVIAHETKVIELDRVAKKYLLIARNNRSLYFNVAKFNYTTKTFDFISQYLMTNILEASVNTSALKYFDCCKLTSDKAVLFTYENNTACSLRIVTINDLNVTVGPAVSSGISANRFLNIISLTENKIVCGAHYNNGDCVYLVGATISGNTITPYGSYLTLATGITTDLSYLAMDKLTDNSLIAGYVNNIGSVILTRVSDNGSSLAITHTNSTTLGNSTNLRLKVLGQKPDNSFNIIVFRHETNFKKHTLTGFNFNGSAFTTISATTEFYAQNNQIDFSVEINPIDLMSFSVAWINKVDNKGHGQYYILPDVPTNIIVYNSGDTILFSGNTTNNINSINVWNNNFLILWSNNNNTTNISLQGGQIMPFVSDLENSRRAGLNPYATFGYLDIYFAEYLSGTDKYDFTKYININTGAWATGVEYGIIGNTTDQAIDGLEGDEKTEYLNGAGEVAKVVLKKKLEFSNIELLETSGVVGANIMKMLRALKENGYPCFLFRYIDNDNSSTAKPDIYFIYEAWVEGDIQSTYGYNTLLTDKGFKIIGKKVTGKPELYERWYWNGTTYVKAY